MPFLREEAERMVDILEAILARLSWPQDADHIVNIRSTLETIKSSLFTTLLDIQSVDDVPDAATAGVVEGDRVEINPRGQLVYDFQPGIDQLKETSIDDVANSTCLHHTALTSPVHNCVVLDNHVAMEMQEPLGNSHNTQDEQNETTSFVTKGNGVECDECNVITNTQCQRDKPLSPSYNHSESDCKSPSPTLQPASSRLDEPGYKPPPTRQRDLLFPMRDQKSLLEIKKTLQKRTDSQEDQEA